ncbi:MAG TPA: hypothetical protein PKL24_16655 [Polyangiaceae bacterium]|nr:MAG: hypothetical protein BWY17_03754 [Deltaproteobacteria bacterium ADurb.Bin207]HNZ23778.1 hypothetical protein [Polyangiaceae bacterium]HOD24557.1 hypothetical protein [Polyangiaceae bacterium]HOE50167.1 hypothetical protein [Polyangiaceae bacterium]HOH01547.1 hypothetical protein [Polyangiaceae bacterium]
MHSVLDAQQRVECLNGGSCELLELLGRGGSGHVYRAKDALGKDVAVKVLPLREGRQEDRL